MSSGAITITAGRPLPLGATVQERGVQFALFSRHGRSVSLCLFSEQQEEQPRREIVFDPKQNRTGDIWHIFVEGIGPDQLYLYRVDGPYEPQKGHRFDAERLLIDPYAKALAGKSGYAARGPQDVNPVPKCVVVDDDFDWGGDRPLNYPLRFSVIYETHVRGLSIDPSSGVEHPGTFRGLAEMLPHFRELGVTSVELLPVQEYDEFENDRRRPGTGELLKNYWGYSPVAFFAPKQSYASAQNPGSQVHEFKSMVRDLHTGGIEVILDVVFNHTAEGNEKGSTFCFRGLDNSIYYLLEEKDGAYRNFSGCGNTMNCNHPIVRSLILDCLRYWVMEMHVDGFRFDLGSILGRDRSGHLMENPPILERIAEDPVLRQTKIIAEAWDAAGAYQVGSFPGGRWAEWNDRFRDDVRSFWRGDEGMVSKVATRITGSSDLYLRDGRKPFHSINFITSHDGFTLNDLVSYSRKHNFANGEDNKDGSDYNLSRNYGAEGETDDPQINELRKRQIKNFLTTLMLSLGTPMLLGGDEFGRTQQGNNNAYCQDSALSWYDWKLREKNSDIFAFCRKLVAFRARHPAFHRPEFYTGRDTNYNAVPDISWFDEKAREIDWERRDNFLAFRIDGSHAEIQSDVDDSDFYFVLNAADRDVDFILAPPLDGKKWSLAVDTAFADPFDCCVNAVESSAGNEVFSARAFSSLVFIS